jgi:hypothetical protein
MARLPKEDEAPRRTAFLGFQLTPSERAEIDRRAAASGYRVSDYCRIILLSGRNAPAPPARDLGLIRAFLAQFAKLGNNVNQMARHANEGRGLPSAKALADMAAQLRAAVQKVLAL